LLGCVHDNVKKRSAYLWDKLEDIKKKSSFVTDHRGQGLMQGIELSVEVRDIITNVIDNGVLLINAGKNVIRFVPSLTVSDEEIDEAINVLDKCLADVKA
ncbi:MAG: aminotransferase class III-fold pyridoxal phosphate-dependent enzyme, partial [Firmicutes bacterium]|nr:aminotransferase class III-fold pyridoxal phosphate-dependent enzyme [Bacillota bacterium]